MSGYVERVWEEGDPTSWAQIVVSAMAHFEPEWRQELHGTRRLLKAWGRLEIVTGLHIYQQSMLWHWRE